MSNLADQLFSGLKDLVPEAKAELSRLGTQGTMELASALFNGSAFVPYGPGQYTPSPSQEMGGQAQGMDSPAVAPEQEQSHGRSM